MPVTMALLDLTYHVSKAGLGVVNLDLGAVALRVKEKRRHRSLGLGGILWTQANSFQ